MSNNIANFTLDSTPINPPIEQEGLQIKAEYIEGTLSEVQPVLSTDRFTFTNKGLSTLLNARDKYGPYQQIPFKFDIGNQSIFNGYLTDLNFLLDIDQIEAKAVSLDSIDGLSELLSSVTSALLRDEYEYENLDFIIEKVDIRPELLQLSLSILFYSYVLYSQIRETIRIISKTFIEGPVNAVGLSFGTIAVAVIQLAAQAIFIAVTIIQLIKYAKETKELLLPKKRTTKVISLYNLLKAAFNKVGYSIATNIEDMKNDYHWASGAIDKDEYFPRSTDRCGTTIGALSFVLEKYNAKVAVFDKTVHIYQEYDNFFFKNSSYTIPSYVTGNYTENIDDMFGTREILYTVDYNDQWTLVNFTGTEYIITANIDDPKKSTIKGIDQTDYGISLCSRKDELNAFEKLWKDFVNFVNSVSSLFGGSNQILAVPNLIGVAKISSDSLNVAKLVRVKNRKIPANHRDLLSAKSDEEKYHWTKSHVRNPRAKKRLYKNIPIKYDANSLAKNIENGYISNENGQRGKFEKIEWEYEKDNAVVDFWIEDIDRNTKLIEEFYEPIR